MKPDRAMSGLTPPVRFLGVVLAAWAVLRTAFWTPLEMPGAKVLGVARPVLPIAAARPRPAREPRPAPLAVRAHGGGPARDLPFPRDFATLAARRAAAAPPPSVPVECATSLDGLCAVSSPPAVESARVEIAAGTTRRSTPAAAPLAASVSRWRFSAWTLWNPAGDGVAFAGNGRLGGSQSGLRAQYRLARPGGIELALSARVSRPIERSGAEAAIGIAARPLRGVPVELIAERRIAVERGGRDAWALGAAGGVDRLALPLGLELDGYAQAGIVGARERDLYGDAALAVTRPLAIGERTILSLGGGAWASAQPGAARVDIGPQAVLRVPAGDTALRVSLGWRQRIAGGAAPGSGPVVTLGTDF